MTRVFRRTVFLVVGLLLGGLFSLSYADTIPATYSTQPSLWRHGNGYLGVVSTWTTYADLNTTYADFCSRYQSALGQTYNPAHSMNLGSCWRLSGSYDSYDIVPGCPNGGTLGGSGLNRTCTNAPTCPSGYSLDAGGTTCTTTVQCEPSQIKRDGQCVCDPAHLASFPTAYGESIEGTGDAPASACVGGCMRKAGDFCLGGGGKYWCSGGAWTAEKCTGGATDSKMPNNKKPPCDATEGVLTSSSGAVLCVPEGTPSARKPTTQKSNSRKTGPNGEVVDIEKTTTHDPATNATTTTIKETTVSSGGSTTTTETESSSGSNGMKPGSGDNSGNEPGDCQKEPDSPTCKKGTVKEKGEFGDGQNAELEAAKGELRAKFAEVKAAATAMFSSGSSGGGGSLPCYAPVSVLGQTFSVCLSNYSEKLAPIGGYVLFAATMLAVFIVLRR